MSKPVRDLSDLISYAFQEGVCTCIRCASGVNQETYKYPHNFDIEGIIYRRQFAKSSKEDLSSKITAILKHHYKDEEVDFTAPLQGSKIADLVSERDYILFLRLGEGNGLFESISDGQISFNEI